MAALLWLLHRECAREARKWAFRCWSEQHKPCSIHCSRAPAEGCWDLLLLRLQLVLRFTPPGRTTTLSWLGPSSRPFLRSHAELFQKWAYRPSSTQWT